MILNRKTTVVTDHLKPASARKHSGIHTVTIPGRAAENNTPAKASPFGKLVFGPEAGAKPTAYKPIFNL